MERAMAGSIGQSTVSLMETIMKLKSLIPFKSRTDLAPSDLNVFGTLHREIDRLFDDFSNGFGTPGTTNLLPNTDVTETDKEIVITTELPGLERKDVEISLENDVLTIRGEKKIETEKEDKKKDVHLAERSYGVFYRALQLPPGVDSSTVRATMSKGVLKITLPKPTRSEAKKIEVKEAA
jgi:HSP20 family protein